MAMLPLPKRAYGLLKLARCPSWRTCCSSAEAVAGVRLGGQRDRLALVEGWLQVGGQEMPPPVMVPLPIALSYLRSQLVDGHSDIVEDAP